MATHLRGGGGAAERCPEALDPDALRHVRRGLARHPAKADRPHSRVPPWPRPDRPLVARRDRAERGVRGGVRPTGADGGDRLPSEKVPRDVRREQPDRLSRRNPTSLLRKRLSGHGTATRSRRNPGGRTSERDASALECSSWRVRVGRRHPRDPHGRRAWLAHRVRYVAGTVAEEDAWGR